MVERVTINKRNVGDHTRSGWGNDGVLYMAEERVDLILQL